MGQSEGYGTVPQESEALSPDAFRRAGHQMVDWIAEYLAHPERASVLPDVEPGALVDRLLAEPPARGTDPSELLAEFERDILPHTVHWNHPGFMAYFAAGGSPPGVLGDLLGAALNNVGLLWRSSPALAELEQVTVGWLGRVLGLPSEWFGLMYDTASTAALHAVIAARQRAAAGARAAGSELDINRIVIYASAEAHSSIEKTMAALGRGVDACRKIPCDGEFAMRPDALRRAVEADLRDGLAPIAVVATIGTTASAAVDPVDEIGDIAAEHSLWLHVDAAYAGAASMLGGLRHHFRGSERADSYVVNPHKWLFVPMHCSVLYTDRPEEFRRALSLTPEYLSSREHPRAVNFMEYSIPLGRRFRALKLWYVLRTFGGSRLASTVSEHIRLAQMLAGWMDESEGFRVLAPVHFSLVCFSYRPNEASDAEADEASKQMLERVNASGEFFLSHAVLGGRFAVRVAIGNLRTSEKHVRRLWHLLLSIATELRPSRQRPGNEEPWGLGVQSMR